MAMATLALKLKHLIALGDVDLSADTVKVILMQQGFVFDPANHEYLADITEDIWVATTAYAEGDIVTPTTPNGRKYICTTAGTSDSVEPTWPVVAAGTVTDGTAVWAYDVPPAIWVASTAYSLGDIVGPTVYDGTGYICTTAGTSDASEPTWLPSGEVSENIVTWTYNGESGADDQVPTGNGYTQNNKSLANMSISVAAVTGAATITWDDPSWVASGGYLGSADANEMLIKGCMVYDDTYASDALIGYVEFSAATFVIDGNGLEIKDIAVQIG